MLSFDKTDWRLSSVLLLVILTAIIVLGRLFFLQITSAEEYRNAAERQHTIATLTTPRRGDIFFEDRSGRLVPVAVTKRVYTLTGNPQKMQDLEKTYDLLAAITDLNEADFFAKAKDSEKTYVVFRKDMDKDIASRIADLELPGIWPVEEETRSYPSGTLASHVLGFLGYVNDEKLGRYGIEQQFEGVLKGVSGSLIGERGARGTILSIGRKIFSPKTNGSDIVLTIDPNVQSFSAKRLAAVKEEWHADSAGVLIINPKTGEILVLEALPSFNPNQYGQVEDYDAFLNPFVQKVYEVGSIFKPLTIAAGLDARAITEDTTYFDAGHVKVGDKVLNNFDGKGRGVQTMGNILEQSLNTGTVFVMQQLGMRVFRDYVENYGLGELTGIDLPSEVRGNISNLNSNREVEYATASFGQGIAVTPISLAAALSSLGNGGELMKPYIVKKRMVDGKVVETTTPTARRRVLQQETSLRISRMLTQVVDTTLANGKVKIPGYSIAAKTGTAQIANIGRSGYSNEYLHTFFGYAPSFDPRFLVLLYLERPQGARYASETLSLPFRDIVEFLINYYEIPPDKQI